MNNLINFLESNIFSKDLMDIRGVINRLNASQTSKGRIRILYGETYDQFGVTLGSLKYYFLIHILHLLLEEVGFRVESDILLCDIAAKMNDSVKDQHLLEKQKAYRVELFEKLKKKYNLKSDLKLLSEIKKREFFRENMTSVYKSYQENDLFKEILKRTVKEDFYTEEIRKKFLYAREEISVILNYDFKLGPPKEIFYDKAANIILNQETVPKLIGLYAKPTYPLGVNFDFFIENEEIEKYGLTPYKAGSYKLQDHRIIINHTSNKKLKKLIDYTYIPKDDNLPNPLLDLVLVSDLSKRIRINNYDFSTKYEFDEKVLKDLSKLISKLILI